MPTIDTILDAILEREGWPTYTEHPNDRGGPTKGGITLRTLEGWRGRRCTRAELKRLKKTEALDILRRRYVEANGIDQIPAGALQAQMIDDAVLSGPMIAVTDLQRAVGTTDDGIIGPKTLAAVGALGLDAAAAQLTIARTLRLCQHVAKHPDQLVFLVGWVSRCLSFLGPAK